MGTFSYSFFVPFTNMNAIYCYLNLLRFYRATHMHSADYAVWQPSVLPSFCPSHAGIVSKRLHISSKFFNHRVAHHSSSSVPNGMGIFRREPLNGGVECKGVWKHHDFRRISRFISEMMQDSAIVTNLLWKANRKQHPIFPMAPISMTLSDL